MAGTGTLRCSLRWVNYSVSEDGHSHCFLKGVGVSCLYFPKFSPCSLRDVLVSRCEGRCLLLDRCCFREAEQRWFLWDINSGTWTWSHGIA